MTDKYFKRQILIGGGRPSVYLVWDISIKSEVTSKLEKWFLKKKGELKYGKITSNNSKRLNR
jgi:hypothetical protein